MSIQIDLSKIPLPKIYRRENADCYYDSYRKRLIQITPEETVRQRVAYYFEKLLNVPEGFMLIEVPLSYYAKNTPGRADIVIHKAAEGGLMTPLAVIECKQPYVSLTDNVAEQAIRYCDAIESEYFIITNGHDFEIAHYDNSENQYKWLNSMLRYDQMLNSEVVFIEKVEPYERLTMQQLSDPENIEDFNDQNPHWVFGQNTPQHLRSFVVNLYDCLMDTSHILPKTKRDSFELIDDLGVRYMDYSNAGGGHYLGCYRAFLVNDPDGNAQIISLSLFGTDANFREENRNSYTSLVVAIDKYKVSHNCLQYNVDKYAKSTNDGVTFVHNGQISSRPAQPLIDLVLRQSKDIRIENSKLLLGKIAADRILYIDDFDVSETVYNFIEYALIREEYSNSTKIRKSQ